MSNSDNPLGHASGDMLAALVAAERQVSTLTPRLRDIVAEFERCDEQLYLVGGSVRDMLLGTASHDLDFTTSARPETVTEILQAHAEAVWDTGIEFGTVSAQVDAQQLEITTFRADLYDGQTRNPEVTFGESLEDDLIRRDFKMNAMAVGLRLGDDGTLAPEFHDPLGGLADLAGQIIDTPAAPELSFRDDPLRMLRAARFSSQLGFKVAPRVLEAMRDMAAEIQRITVERIQAELNKLMLGADPATGIDLLVETGILDYIVPEIPALKMTGDEHHQHKDVYRHSLQVLRQATEQETDGPDLVLRWAALLHDMGKPATRKFKEDGGVSFHQHEVVGAKMSRKRLRALKFPKQVIADISQLIFLHMRFYGFSEGQWTDSAVRRYATDAGELLPRLHKLVRSDSTTRNKRKALRLARAYDRLEERIEEISEKENLAKIRPDLDGNEIMTLLNIPPGPEVGQAWNYLKELRLEHGPMDRDEAEEALKNWWAAKR